MISPEDSVVPEGNPSVSAEPGYRVNATRCASSSLITSTAPAKAGLSYFFADLKKKR